MIDIAEFRWVTVPRRRRERADNDAMPDSEFCSTSRKGLNDRVRAFGDDASTRYRIIVLEVQFQGSATKLT